jgi:hypothetical protein
MALDVIVVVRRRGHDLSQHLLWELADEFRG